MYVYACIRNREEEEEEEEVMFERERERKEEVCRSCETVQMDIFSVLMKVR